MKELKSFLLILGFFVASVTAVHYFVLFTGFSDLVALLLYALPLTLIIAYSITEALGKMLRSAMLIYFCFISVTLSATALVWFIG